MKKDEKPMHDGSYNVFADLGFPEPELHLKKVYLVMCLDQEIKSRGLSQTEAGKLMGISQPKLSKLLRGQVRDCSLDRLFRYLFRLGQDVEIMVTPRAASA